MKVLALSMDDNELYILRMLKEGQGLFFERYPSFRVGKSDGNRKGIKGFIIRKALLKSW